MNGPSPLLIVPEIDAGNAAALEITDIARNNLKFMHQCRCGEQAVDNRQRPTASFGLANNRAPARRDT